MLFTCNFDSAVEETQKCGGVNERDGGVCADDKGRSFICPKDSKSYAGNGYCDLMVRDEDMPQ